MPKSEIQIGKAVLSIVISEWGINYIFDSDPSDNLEFLNNIMMDNGLKQFSLKEMTSRKWIICSIYFLFLLASSVFSYKKPLYNWDVISYMAIIVGIENHNPTDIHDIVYKEAKQYVPEEAYILLVDTAHPFKKKMLNDPLAFNKQLTFYAVKPLYNWLGYLSYKLGVSLPKATVLPSVISYFFIGVLYKVY